MKKTAFGLLLVALVTVVACSKLDQDHGGAGDPGVAGCGAPKTIYVVASASAASVPSSPDHVCFANGVIKWQFASGTTGWVFPANGIAFKTATPYPGCTSYPDPSSASFPITCSGPKQNGAEFHCNKNGPPDKGACYSYTVTVAPAPGNPASAPPPLDPWIQSD